MFGLGKKKIENKGDALVPLSRQEAMILLQKIPSWNMDVYAKELSRTYVVKDFAEAMQLGNDIAKLAEDAKHHPGLYIAWGKVRVVLATHDIGGLSEKDFALAEKIDRRISSG